MKIVCLVKQIPRPDCIEFDPETKALKREGVPLVLNELDRRSLAAECGPPRCLPPRGR